MTLPSERNFHDPQTQALPGLSGYHRVRDSLGDAHSEAVKRSRIRQVSEKRRLENIERKRAMEEAFGPRSWWQCEVLKRLLDGDTRYAIMGQCRGDINGHELLKSSQGGSRTDMENVVPLCNFHNCWVEDHPLAADELGLVIHPSF